jgi:hypothetical protein
MVIRLSIKKIKRLISFGLFCSSFHLNPKPRCNNLFSSILKSTFSIFLKSYWSWASSCGNFAPLWIVLTKLWLFDGWLSFRSWLTSTYCKTSTCSTSCSIVRYNLQCCNYCHLYMVNIHATINHLWEHFVTKMLGCKIHQTLFQ